MPAVEIAPSDLAPFAVIDEPKAQAMIEDALAMAARVAPCILLEEFNYPEAAKAILRSAVLRWNESGSGAMTQHSVTRGPFGETQTYDNRQTRRGMFWPSEIEELQKLCRGEERSGAAFSVRLSGGTSAHMPWCSLMLGAKYCSCGADLTNHEYPLYEGGVLSTGDEH